MELKVVCGCGQKFKFDVEPVGGRMPFAINCPVCNADGTVAANAILAAQNFTAPASPPVAPVSSGLKINRPEAAPPPLPPAPPIAPLRSPVPTPARTNSKAAGEFNLGLGILGAFLGAGLGVGLMFGFYEWAGFRFPLLGVGIGALTGLGAKLLYKGTDNTLGFISGGIALVSVVGTLFLMYGTFPLLSIISVAVSVSFAYRISSG